ncbi:MAG: CRISPR-associated protein Cas5 [Deinococcota bacterium]|jgi:CRISPR-associated protein Cas5h|nr:CRISPR-associated protein Cas5 [Deinococcota bacterium]
MEPASARPVVVFRYWGRFGHFLRAEASASALSYPVPPRTVLLGLTGAVLGLEKDAPQEVLKDALFAVSGAQPPTHWHRAKFRKDPPAALAMRIKAGAKGSEAPEKATLIKQEWLLNPDYHITANLPEPYHAQLVKRLEERHWHYSPCLGLSEMNAELELVSTGTATPIDGEQPLACHSLIRQDKVTVEGQRFLEDRLEIQVLRMPRAVTADRVFIHANYLIERCGRPIPVRTADAWHVLLPEEDHHVMFL